MMCKCVNVHVCVFTQFHANCINYNYTPSHFLPQINGVNGTLIANQNVRDDPSQQNPPVRTLITLDNGGFWELV